MNRPAFLLSVLLLLAVSCREPRSTEVFIRGSGPYVFTADMTDSTAVYEFDLFTRIDAPESPAELQLVVSWKGPEGDAPVWEEDGSVQASKSLDFTETVYLPVGKGTSFFSHDAYAPYRGAVVPVRWGVWTLTVTVPAAPEGLRGMGLVIRRSERFPQNAEM